MYTMKEICQNVGVTYQTLKFYCNEGLIPNVKRDENNYRIFDENDLGWIKGLICLKKCGFSIKEMQIFLELCLQGESSIQDRRILLAKHKEDLLEQIEQIKESIAYIDHKEEYYSSVLQGKTKYESNLLKKQEIEGSKES